jgi:hypothetical protein
MISTILEDLTKSGEFVNIYVPGGCFKKAVITKVDDIFIEFQYEPNGMTYTEPIANILRTWRPTSGVWPI